MPLPMLGFGTTHNEGGTQTKSILAALQAGYRLVDTAKRYGTEENVGAAIKASGIDRKEIFVTSKLWPADAARVRQACEESCKRLGTTYLDLYLIHWPGIGGPTGRRRVWAAMEDLHRRGVCRAIGVSNFLQEHLEDLLEHCTVKPAVNQIEFNPFQYPKALLKYCQSKGVVLQGYCPLAKGTKLRHPTIVRIAKANGISPAQVMILWSVQHGVSAIPKSNRPAHIRANIEALRMPELGPQDMAALDGLHCNLRVTWDPTGVR